MFEGAARQVLELQPDDLQSPVVLAVGRPALKYLDRGEFSEPGLLIDILRLLKSGEPGLSVDLLLDEAHELLGVAPESDDIEVAEHARNPQVVVVLGQERLPVPTQILRTSFELAEVGQCDQICE